MNPETLLHLAYLIQESAIHSSHHKFHPLETNVQKYTPSAYSDLQYESIYLNLYIGLLIFMMIRTDSIETEAPN